MRLLKVLKRRYFISLYMKYCGGDRGNYNLLILKVEFSVSKVDSLLFYL